MVGILLRFEQPGHFHAPRLCHAAQVVPDHVDDHHVLRPFLVGRQESPGLRKVFGLRPAPSGSPLHWAAFDTCAVEPKEQLRRGAGDNPLPGIQKGPIRGILRRHQTQEQTPRVAHELSPEAIGVVHLVSVAATDQGLDPRQMLAKLLAADGCLPAPQGCVFAIPRGSQRDLLDSTKESEPQQRKATVIVYDERTVKCRRCLVRNEACCIKALPLYRLFHALEALVDVCQRLSCQKTLRTDEAQPTTAAASRIMTRVRDNGLMLELCIFS